MFNSALPAYQHDLSSEAQCSALVIKPKGDAESISVVLTLIMIATLTHSLMKQFEALPAITRATTKCREA